MRERLLALRESSGLSFAQLILAALGQIELDVSAARARGHKDGYSEGYTKGVAAGRDKGFAAAAARFRLSYPCNVCSKPLIIEAGAADADVAIKALTGGGWGHDTCQEQVTYEVVRLKT